MTTEQAQQTVQETAQGTTQETAEPLTPQQAQAEIERLYGDPEFLKVYLDRGNDDSGVRKESFSKMHKLFALAHPNDKPVSDTPRLEEMLTERDQEKQQVQQPPSEDEQAEAELNEATQVMESRFGPDWKDEMEDVRDSIREVGGERGEALFEHLQSNHGNDPEVMGMLMNLQRENENYPIVAALAELVDQNMTPNGAILKLDELLADQEFVSRYTDENARGHNASIARMRALFIAADSPAFITSGAQG